MDYQESKRKLVERKNKNFRFAALTYSGLSTAEINLAPLLLYNGYENYYHDTLNVYMSLDEIDQLIKDLEKVKKNIIEGME